MMRIFHLKFTDAYNDVKSEEYQCIYIHIPNMSRAHISFVSRAPHLIIIDDFNQKENRVNMVRHREFATGYL